MISKRVVVPLILVILAVVAVMAWRMNDAPVVEKAVAPVNEGPSEIVIGYNAAQSKNSVANFGIAARLGVEIAIEEINAQGGILGKPVRGIYLDDEGDKEISKKNMEKLIFEDKVNAVIGPANSGNALYWLDIPQDNEVVTISPIATATEITTRYIDRPRNYIFRISSLDKEQVRHLVAWTLTRVNEGKIAILHDTTPYGTQGEKDVTEVLARWGKTPVSVKAVDKTSSETQLIAALKEAQAAGAEAIVIYSLVDVSSAVVKASEKIKGFKPLLLGTAANAIDLWAAAGPASTNLYFSAVIVDETLPNVMRLQELAKAHNNGTVSPAITTTANGYDAVYLLKAAFENADSTDRKAVRDALEDVDGVQGIIRTYARPFSKTDHEAMSASDFTIGHWVDGKRELLADEVRDLEIR